jgi:hypothetical protein
MTSRGHDRECEPGIRKLFMLALAWRFVVTDDFQISQRRLTGQGLNAESSCVEKKKI